MPCSGGGGGEGEEAAGGGGGGSTADIMYADPKDAVAAKRNFLANNTLTISKVLFYVVVMVGVVLLVI